MCCINAWSRCLCSPVPYQLTVITGTLKPNFPTASVEASGQMAHLANKERATTTSGLTMVPLWKCQDGPIGTLDLCHVTLCKGVRHCDNHSENIFSLYTSTILHKKFIICIFECTMACSFSISKINLDKSNIGSEILET